MPCLRQLLPFLLLSTSVYGSTIRTPRQEEQARPSSDFKVVILGGGVAGVIAARTLHENGVDNFVIVEARDELGGRLMSADFAGTTVELGANWVQGTQTKGGPANPILTLVQKHNVSTQFNDLYGSMTTYDNTGAVDYLDVFNTAVDDLVNLITKADDRAAKQLVDITARAAYSLVGAKPQDAHAKAAEYFQFDWEYAQNPSQSSAVASAWNSDFTFDASLGGFSEENLLAIDQRGFKTFIQKEAQGFLKPNQLRLNATVKGVTRSPNGVKVTLKDGSSITGDYALCTFSVGVLQNDDVEFQPALPDFKKEAIESMTMGTYTKIFLKFPTKFWFDTEMALYADPERGRYPVWQSLDHKNFLPGSGIIFVTVTGDYSERIEALSDDQVKQEVLGVLHAMYPNITIPAPTAFMFPRWHSDPLYRGSYSNWPPSFFREHHDNLRANVDRLYFAGEATSQKYFGFLHGAYFEGQDVASKIAECVKNGQCASLQHFEEVKNAGSYGL